MKDVLVLTSDPELGGTAELCSGQLEASFQIATRAEEIGRLLAERLANICAVIIDADTVDLAAAWVRILGAAAPQIPVIGVSRYRPALLPDTRNLRNIEQWLRKTVTMEEIVDALIPYCAGRARPFRFADPGPAATEAARDDGSSSLAVMVA